MNSYCNATIWVAFYCINKLCGKLIRMLADYATDCFHGHIISTLCTMNIQNMILILWLYNILNKHIMSYSFLRVISNGPNKNQDKREEKLNRIFFVHILLIIVHEKPDWIKNKVKQKKY
jgi:hypothetical protein